MADRPAITISQNERQWLLLRCAFGAFEEHATRDVIAWLRKEYGEDDWLVQAMKAVTAKFGGTMLQNRLRAVVAKLTLDLPEDPSTARNTVVDHLKIKEHWLYRALQTLKDEAERDKAVDEAMGVGSVAVFVPMLDWDVYVLVVITRKFAMSEDHTVCNALESIRHVLEHPCPRDDECILGIQRVLDFCVSTKIGTGCIDTVSKLLVASKNNAGDTAVSVSAGEWNSLCLFRALSAFRSAIHSGVEAYRTAAKDNLEQKRVAAAKYPDDSKKQKQVETAQRELEKVIAQTEEMLEEEDTQVMITWLQKAANQPVLKASFDINLGDPAIRHAFKASLSCIRDVRNALSHQIALGLRLADKINKVADALDFFKASVEAQNLRSGSVGNTTDASAATVKLAVAATTCSAAEGAGGTHEPQPRLLRVLPTDGFVDRCQDPHASLSSVVESLATLGSCVVIIGDAGIGKSELCKQVLATVEYDVAFKYTLRGSTLRADLLAFGSNHMGVAGTDDNALHALKVKLAQQSGDWCIAVDDAHEASVEDLEWLPVGSGRLLLLGRRSIPVKSTKTVSLKSFSSKESLELVMTTLNGFGRVDEKNKVDIDFIAECTGDTAVDCAGGAGGAGKHHSDPPFLATELENLPLAVAMFATAVKNVKANIKAPGMNTEAKARAALNAVINRFREERTLEEETPGALASATSLRHPGMRYICRMALKDLESCPEALALASMLAVLSPTMTPRFLFEMDGRLAADVAKLRWSSVFTKAKFNAGLLPLMKCNLVRVAKQEPPKIPFARLTMHALVQKELRGLIDGIVLRDAQEVLRRVLKACYLDMDVDKARGDRGAFLWLEQLTPCVEAFHRSGVVPREGKTGAAARSSWAFRLARVKQELCAYREALAHYEDARCLKVVAYGHMHPDVAATLRNMGVVLDSQGEYQKALEKYTECRRIEDIVWPGHNHPSVAATLDNMGIVHKAQGNYDKALEHYEKALKIRNSVLGHNRIDLLPCCYPDVAKTLCNMAVVYMNQGYYAKALKVYEESLAIDTKVHGGRNHPDVAVTLGNMATVYGSMGNYEKALEMLEEELQINISFKGHEHPDVARTLNNMGNVLKSQGSYAEALCKFEESLKIKIAVFGHMHPDVARTLNNMGNVLKSQGSYAEALCKFEESLKIEIAVFGHMHPSVAATLDNMGIVHKAQGNYDKALEHHEKALKIRNSVLGHNHLGVAKSIGGIAMVKEAQGDYDGALVDYEKANKMLVKFHGHEHPDIDALSFVNGSRLVLYRLATLLLPGRGMHAWEHRQCPPGTRKLC